MKVVFMGTPDFAVASLEALADEHTVCAVFTRADQPKNRGMALTPSPVKLAALARDIPVFQPERLSEDGVVQTLSALQPDVIVVAAYGLLLPPDVLRIPPFGCLNIHASLLPRWRGASPINAALFAGDEVSGITIMRMDEGLDTGDILLLHATRLSEDMTFGDLHDRLREMGARAVQVALQGLEAGALTPQPQSSEDATYAPRLTTGDRRVHFAHSAGFVRNRIRGLDPTPGAFAELGGQRIKLFGVSLVQERGEVGRIMRCDESGVTVGCAADAVCISQLQAEGGKRMGAAEFFRGHAALREMRFM